MHTATTYTSTPHHQSLQASYKGKKGGCLSVGVIAQWQSAGSLGQRPWVHLPAAPLFIRALCRFKGLWTVMAQIVSFTRCYWSSDHRGVPSIKVPSIGLLHCCDSACDLSHQTGDAINFQHWPIWLRWPMACPPPALLLTLTSRQLPPLGPRM